MRRHPAVALLFLLALGCAPEVREGYYACAADSDCPAGWVCRADGRCWSRPASDAGRDGGPDSGPDAGDSGPDGGDSGTDGCMARPRPVDLLVMVDDSNSMAEEQAALTEAFPELVRALATGDVEPDGTPDFDPVADLHVGVVTSDMGTAGYDLPSCAEPDFGDDGVLRTAGNPTRSDCDETYPPFLEYAPGGMLSRFRADFTCVATAGTGGCGFEQPLEAVLKALTPSDASLRFHGDTTGHGDGANAGFLREESVLVVLLVTDEDDCSAEDPRLFDGSMGSPYAGTNLNLRCQEHGGALHPISRYADGLRALRPGHPERLVFAALTGVPLELEEAPYEGILDDDEMQYRASVDMRPLPACSTDVDNAALPARRIVRTARELQLLGSPTLVRSICRTDFEAPLRALLERITPRLTPLPCDP
jgi:Cys-rich repeat protein